jgi:hypothetical protein
VPVPGAPPDPSTDASGAAVAGRMKGREVEIYRKDTHAATDRLMALRPVLTSIDKLAAQSADALQMAAEEFATVRRLLTSIRPPDGLKPTHDLLIRSCTFGATAAGLRLQSLRSGDVEAARNASSAAAGALLLLDRVCADIGCAQR